ncbi:hypothetical protein D9M71_424900 [compost metagenome]
MLDGLHEHTGLQQTLVRTSVQPSETASEYFNMQSATFKVGLIDAGDFQLATLRRLHMLSNFHHIVVVEIQAGDSIAGLRLPRLFLD